MDDHKSKLPLAPLPDDRSTRAEPRIGLGFYQAESIPPILPQHRAAMRWHQEKMPAEGAELIRSGFAIAASMLGMLALAGSWMSWWALIPATLAVVLAPTGVFSHHRRWAILGIVLGILALFVSSLWLSTSAMGL